MYSEGKRRADTVEHLETGEVKKPKLESGDASQDEHPMEEDAITEQDSDGPHGTGVLVPSDKPTPADESARLDRQKKGKTKGQGGDIHFKENPYTFLKEDDLVIKTCM